MKKYLVILLIAVLALLASECFAASGKKKVIARKNAACDSTAWTCDSEAFCLDWDGVGADDERCATTPCPDTGDAEVNDSAMSVSSDALVLAMAGATDTYVRYDPNFNYTEVTFLFEWCIDDLTPHSADEDVLMGGLGVNSLGNWLFSGGLWFDFSESTLHPYFKIYLDSGTDTGTGNALSLTVDTCYRGYIYSKRATGAATNDGIIEVGLRDNTCTYKTAGGTTYDNYNLWADNGNFDSVRTGIFQVGLTSDAASITLRIFRVYNGDQRP